MGIFRRYEWSFRGTSLWYEKDWPDSWISELEDLPHDITDTDGYAHYVNNDPYESDLFDFFEEVIELTDQYASMTCERDQLEACLAFVQHLNYYSEQGEYPRYPMETLIEGGGDCEDTAILMAAIAQKCGYQCALIEFHGDDSWGEGEWGHVDLGIAESYSSEFSGTYWTHDEVQYYYCHCNGRNYAIGEYSGKWGDNARVFPVN